MKRIHRAWAVCAGCALLLFCTSGLTINAFTVYQPFIMEQNGFSNVQTSTLTTVRSLCSFATMFLSGLYYRKLSLRRGMGLAGLTVAAGFALYGLAKTYAGYCVAAGVIGFGYGLGTMIPISIVLEHWFVTKRTLAIGLCSCVTGISTLGIPTLLTLLVERRGLRFAFLAEACAVVCLILISYLLLRSSPEEVGERPYGEGEQSVGETRAERAAMPAWHWWVLIPMILLMGGVMCVGYSHISVRIRANGFSSYTVANGVMISGLALTAGKFGYGAVAEKIGCFRANRFFSALLLGGVLLCGLNWRSERMVYLAMPIFGAGLGMPSVGLTAWAGDWCSREQYDGVIRRFQLSYAAGCMLFASLPGYLADRAGGSYVPAYRLFFVLALIIMACAQSMYLLRGENKKARPLTGRKTR